MFFWKCELQKCRLAILFYSCNMGRSGLPDMSTPMPEGKGVDISGRPLLPMLQLLCNTFKADSLVANTSAIAASFIYPCLEDSIMVRQQ